MQPVMRENGDFGDLSGASLPDQRESFRRNGLSEVRVAERPFAGAGCVKGDVDLCQPIGPYLAVRGSESPALVLLGEDGRPVDAAGMRCPLGLASKDIVDYMQENKLASLPVSSRDDKIVKRLCDHFCLTPGESDALKSALSAFDTEKRGYLSLEKLAELSPGIIPTIPRNAHFSMTPDGRTLLAISPTEINPVRVADEDGGVLPAAKWERLPRHIIKSINSDHLRKLPGLVAHDGDNAAAQVRGGSYVVQRFGRGLSINESAAPDKPIFTDQARAFCLDPKDGATVWYLRGEGRELVRVDPARVRNLRNKVEVSELPIDASWIGFEPTGNYLLAVSSRGNQNVLHVMDREDLAEVARFAGVGKEISCRADGTLFTRGGDGKVRELSTNFVEISRGELSQALGREQHELKELLDLVEAVDLPALSLSPKPANRVDNEPNRYLKQAGEVLQRRFGQAVAAADSEQALDLVKEQIEQLKLRPDLSAYPEIFEPLEKALAEKRGGFKLAAFGEELKSLRGELGTELSVERAPEIGDALAGLWRERSELTIRDRSVRKAIDGELKELTAEYDGKLEKLRESVRGELKIAMDRLRELVGESMSVAELEEVRGDESARRFSQLTGVLTEDERKEWGRRLASLEAEKKDSLIRDGRERAAQERTRLNVALERLSEDFGRIEEGLKRVNSQSELKDWQSSSALLRSYRRSLTDLSAEQRQLKEEELDRCLAEKERQLTRPTAHDISTRNGVVEFGKVSFPVFPGYSSMASPKILAAHPGATKGRLAFEGVGGRLYEPDDRLVPIDLDNPATAALINEHREGAIRYFQSRERRVPKHQDFWVVNEFVSEQLADLAQLFQMSRTLGKGIVILEGDAGVGKNILFEMLAHYTNRELFTFACNRKTEKEDLTYAYMYDKERGTYRASSELVQALQTPGALIIFDEVNTLPVGVSKLLNPLFDHRRSLFMPFGQDVVADPTVLFGGAMNPRNYLGTQDLPYEFVDRALISEVAYPPEKNKDGRWAPYEAEVISQYIGSLRGLKRNEFYRAWNHVINKENDPSVGRFLDRNQEERIKDLHYIVQVANRLREAYRGYQSGQNSDIEVNLVFSMRGAEWIAAAMNLGMDVKSAVKKVVMPKAANVSERRVLEEIIRNVDRG